MQEQELVETPACESEKVVHIKLSGEEACQNINKAEDNLTKRIQNIKSDWFDMMYNVEFKPENPVIDTILTEKAEQFSGKNIQMNLQNDLANSADINFNNIVKVSFTIAQDNTMKGMQVLESSGSDQIDEIVLRSIKNTLKYVSVPKVKDFKSDYFLTLIINF